MLKKLFITILLAFTLILYLSACETEQADKTITGRIKVVATLFPQYDFARQIAGDKAHISLLLPPGVESHAFEPSPRDIVNIKNAGLFIYTGEFMEPWADRILEGATDNGLIVVDASMGIQLLDEDEESHGEESEQHEEEKEHHEGKDPHIWLDPVNAIKMVENITEGLVRSDSKNESYYRENAAAYIKELKELDAKFSEAFSKVKSRKIIYGGHFAFGYFAKRYGLEHVSPYLGFAPDAEPNPKKIAELVRNIEESGSKYIFYEELVEPKVAKVIADETGAEMLLLHGAHNISREELTGGITYIEIMESNLEKLKQGLGYSE